MIFLFDPFIKNEFDALNTMVLGDGHVSKYARMGRRTICSPSLGKILPFYGYNKFH